ncbi:MAG: group 1 glycosyl transferase, partial [Firmicutes bacterium]|nr:group 1 glycosyl transferase [Bacillota bacterium]
MMLPMAFDSYIYYTVFNSPLFWKGIPHYGKNVVFEVSDTDRLSNLALYFFREQPVDEIVTPSQWSKQGFVNVNKPIHVIPHPLDPRMF